MCGNLCECSLGTVLQVEGTGRAQSWRQRLACVTNSRRGCVAWVRGLWKEPGLGRQEDQITKTLVKDVGVHSAYKGEAAVGSGQRIDERRLIPWKDLQLPCGTWTAARQRWKQRGQLGGPCSCPGTGWWWEELVRSSSIPGTS